MSRGVSALVFIVVTACGGSEKPGPTPQAGSASNAEPAHAPTAPSPGPPPPRDCSLLAPAIDRIIAAEIADIRANRPKEVAPIAEQEAEATRTLLDAVLPAQCEAGQWSGAYTACVDAANTRDEARACQVHLSATQQATLEQAIRDGAGPPAGTLGIAECNQWEQITNKLAQCDKFPAESRDAIIRGVKQTMDAWRAQQMTADTVRSIENACKAAVDAMTTSMKQLGCAI